RTSCAYCSTPLLPPGPTLFPYTTLFRSRCFNSHGIHVGRLGRQDGGRTYTVAASGRVFETFVPAWRTLTTASRVLRRDRGSQGADRKSTRLNSSHVKISYAVFCLKKKQY